MSESDTIEADSHDQAHAHNASLFGDEPSTRLLLHRQRIPSGATVLDLGCGQGRDSLYLAREGFTVHALDPSTVAIEHVRETAAAKGLAVKALLGRFDTHTAPQGA